MIDKNPITIKEQIEARNTNISITLSEIGLSNFQLELPPIHEITKIKELFKTKNNIEDFVRENQTIRDEYFKRKLEKLKSYSNEFENSPKYLYHIASLLNELGQKEDAKKYLENAIHLKKDPFLLNKYALLELKEGETQKGYKILKDLSKNDYFANLNIVLIELQNKNFESVHKYLNNAVKINPLRFEAYYLLCLIKLIEGKINEAIKAAKISLDLKNNSSTLYYLLSLCYYLLNNTDKAEKNLLVSLQLYKYNKFALVLYCDTNKDYYKLNNIIRYLEDYLQFDQKSPEIWDRLARSYFLNSKYDKAIELLRHQASIDDSFAVWNNMAITYINNNNKKKGEQFFNLALKKQPEINKPIVLLNYSNFLYSNHRYKEIIKLFYDFKIEKDLDYKQSLYYSEFILNSIRSLVKESRQNEAIDIAIRTINDKRFDEFCLINVKNFLLYFFSLRHIEYDLISQLINELEEDVGKITLPEKTKLRVLNNILYSLIDINEFNRAGEIFRKIFNDIDQDVFLNATYGLYSFRIGDINNGIAYYKKSISLAINQELKTNLNRKLNYEIAYYFFNKGEKKKAIEAIKKAFKFKTTIIEFEKETQDLKSKIMDLGV